MSTSLRYNSYSNLKRCIVKGSSGGEPGKRRRRRLSDQNFAATLGHPSFRVIEHFLSEAQLLWRDFQKLIVSQPRERLLERELLVRIEGHRRFRCRRPDVRRVLLLGRVNNHV